MASIRKRRGVYFVRFVDEHGIKRERKAYSDRQASEALARRLGRDAARRREGITDAFDDHARKPLAEHLADYRATLEAGDHSRMYVSNAHSAVRAAIEGIKATYFRDISPSAMQRYLGTLADAGKSPRTVNNRLDAVRAFLNWAVADRRMAANPLVGMAKRNVDADRRRVRRSLSVDELHRLVESARAGRSVEGADGSIRAVAYMLAGYAGLRRDEVGGLVRDDVDLEDGMLTVRANVAKNGRRADLPICEPLQQELVRYFETREPFRRDEPIVPIKGARTFAMVRHDLERAGIPFETPSGRVDFHALRATFASNLARAGVPIQTARELMRHSTIQLTASVYTKLELRDMQGAIGRLGELASSCQGQEEIAVAVGMDPKPAHIWPTNVGSDRQSTATRSHRSVAGFSAQPPTLSIVGAPSASDGENRRKPLRSWPARTRT